jgi:signal transduction histidine kinase
MAIAVRSLSENQTVPIQLRRAPARSADGTRLAALRAPLLVKLAGANLFVVVVLGLIWLHQAATQMSAGLVAAVIVLLLVHGGLLLVALRPVRDLEVVADRVWRGDYRARVESSAVADQEVLRVGAMFNLLLDGLARDRARMRALAEEVIAVGDRERAALARELHDSTAQRLAALLFEISAAARDSDDPPLRDRLAAARDMAEELTEEVRKLAMTVHPRVLDDLGLASALQKLARDSSRGTGIDVDVDAPREAAELPHGVASVLYRVAQESIRNAVCHASPRRIHVALHLGGGEARLEVNDDGVGFDLADAERRRPGMGLFTMRERVALVDGEFQVRTAPGDGTTVCACVPLETLAVAH